MCRRLPFLLSLGFLLWSVLALGSAVALSGAVCGDGSCAPGVEDCGVCPGDCPCPGGLVCQNRQCVDPGPVCGDGSCAPGVEDCGVCPGDCPCPGGLVCQNSQCVEPPAVCGDGSCAPGVEDCGVCPGDCPCPGGLVCQNRQCVDPGPVCGDGSCAPGVEDCGVCPGDCPCPGGLVCQNRQCVDPGPVCGDGSCAPGVEDCGICPGDCPCPGGLVCQNRQCVEPGPVCGDGTCTPGQEDCGSCIADCPCWDPSFPTCQNGQCVAAVACGDGVCDPTIGEGPASCPADCFCGDGRCAPGEEDCGSCPGDCPCWNPAAPVCQGGVCVAAGGCGDGTCDPATGEGPASCPADCFCGDGRCAPGEEDCGSCYQDCPCAEGTGCANRQCVTAQCGVGGCAAGCALKPTFGISTTTPDANQTVIFTATPAFIDDPSPKWDLGNGVHLEGSPLTYAYPVGGTYSVILTATDARCHTTQLSDPLTVVVSDCGDRVCAAGEEATCRADCGDCQLDCTDAFPNGDCSYVCTEVEDARIASLDLPTELADGTVYEGAITMRNAGSTSWSATAGHALAAAGDSDPFTSTVRLELPAGVTVPPNGSFTFPLILEPPPGTGSDVTRWRMRRVDLGFGEQVEATISYSEGGGGPPDEPGRRAVTVRLDDDSFVIADSISAHTTDEIISLVLRADRSTRSDCTDLPAADGLIDGGSSPATAGLGDRLFISDHYMAWFDNTPRGNEPAPWGGPWHRSGALAGWWSLDPATRDFRFLRSGPRCSGWAHNELLPGSASPLGERNRWDKFAPPTEQCVTVAPCTHPCIDEFFCFHYAGNTPTWKRIAGLPPIADGVRYASRGLMTRPDGATELPGGGTIDARLEYVLRPDGIRVIWKIRPSRTIEQASNVFMYLWTAYAQDMDGTACDVGGSGNDYPDRVFDQPTCHTSSLSTRRTVDGQTFPPGATVPFVFDPPCGTRNQDLASLAPGNGARMSLGVCAGQPRWHLTVLGRPGTGSGTEADPERIVWPRMLSWNENRQDGTIGFGIDGIGTLTRFEGGRWYVGEYLLQSAPVPPSVSAVSTPIASAGGPYAARPGEAIVLDGTASHDPDGEPIDYAWRFDAGGTGGGARPELSFATPGDYEVALTVRDGAQQASTATSRITVDGSCEPGSAVFTFTGAEQSFVVPPACSRMTVLAWGGGGGGSFAAAGGGGGHALAAVQVTPGETLAVLVGGGGGAGNRYPGGIGGFAGGGSGGDSASGRSGGGGGGRSALRRGAIELVSAAGGGGGSGKYAGLAADGGGGGGEQGATGGYVLFMHGGEGGTQSAGGAGGDGTSQGQSDGAVGSAFQGGAGGASAWAGSGGGGGGLFGGGSGATGNVSNGTAAGGGGGSSYVGGPGVVGLTAAAIGRVPGGAGLGERGGAGDGAVAAPASQGGPRAGAAGRVVLRWGTPSAAADPVLDPPAGTYGEAQLVTATTTTPDASVHYTLDGSDPTPDDPTLTAGPPLLVDRVRTVRARAFAPGLLPSAVVEVRYVIDHPCQAGSDTLTFTGDAQLFVTPPGCTTLSVHAWGGGGGGSYAADGGGGGYARGDIAVVPGETLWVLVGGGGGAGNRPAGGIGGFVGGGRGGDSSSGRSGAGGGGLSAVGRDDMPLLIAAGGGGGSGRYAGLSAAGGAGGGVHGVAGELVLFMGGGGGGTQTGGGAGGNGSDQGQSDGEAGQVIQGGHGGASAWAGSGGGGSGLFGGGSGATGNVSNGTAGGGGGGSSYLAAAVSAGVTEAGGGRVPGGAAVPGRDGAGDGAPAAAASAGGPFPGAPGKVLVRWQP